MLPPCGLPAPTPAPQLRDPTVQLPSGARRGRWAAAPPPVSGSHAPERSGHAPCRHSLRPRAPDPRRTLGSGRRQLRLPGAPPRRRRRRQIWRSRLTVLHRYAPWPPNPSPGAVLPGPAPEKALPRHREPRPLSLAAPPRHGPREFGPGGAVAGEARDAPSHQAALPPGAQGSVAATAPQHPQPPSASWPARSRTDRE